MVQWNVLSAGRSTSRTVGVMLSEESRIVLPDSARRPRRTSRSAPGVSPWSHRHLRARMPRPLSRVPRPAGLPGLVGRRVPAAVRRERRPEKTPRPWDAIHLENEYVRLMILPELGGRIHVGHDKTRGYDFFYRNDVIKPALVGLARPLGVRRRRVQLAPAPPARDLPADRVDASSRRTTARSPSGAPTTTPSRGCRACTACGCARQRADRAARRIWSTAPTTCRPSCGGRTSPPR